VTGVRAKPVWRRDCARFGNVAVLTGVGVIQNRGCSSGDSTFTIADQIYPTLEQFASVDFVKIYDSAGHRETPSGSSDSIPACLEP
jgi:hypothetical protein